METNSREPQVKNVERIVRILTMYFPSEESYSALERLRSRVTDSSLRDTFASWLATLRAKVDGQWNEDWWKQNRTMSPAGQDLHYRELLLANAALGDRVSFLVDAAKAAWNSDNEAKAEAYARQLLATPDLATKSGDGVYHANYILGMLALRRGDVAGAKRYLIESAKSPGLTAGGPGFDLVEALLDHGERDAVLEYLDVGKDLLRHEDLIEQWKTLIRSGITPRLGQEWRQANINEALH
jgi:hypothetical protein